MTIKNRLHNLSMIVKTFNDCEDDSFVYIFTMRMVILLNLYNFILYNSSNQIIYFYAIG